MTNTRKQHRKNRKKQKVVTSLLLANVVLGNVGVPIASATSQTGSATPTPPPTPTQPTSGGVSGAPASGSQTPAPTPPAPTQPAQPAQASAPTAPTGGTPAPAPAQPAPAPAQAQPQAPAQPAQAPKPDSVTPSVGNIVSNIYLDGGYTDSAKNGQTYRIWAKNSAVMFSTSKPFQSVVLSSDTNAFAPIELSYAQLGKTVSPNLYRIPIWDILPNIKEPKGNLGIRLVVKETNNGVGELHNLDPLFNNYAIQHVADKNPPVIDPLRLEGGKTVKLTNALTVYPDVNSAPQIKGKVSDDENLANLKIRAYINGKDISALVLYDKATGEFTVDRQAFLNGDPMKVTQAIAVDVTDSTGQVSLQTIGVNYVDPSLIVSRGTFKPTKGEKIGDTFYGQTAGTIEDFTNTFNLPIVRFATHLNPDADITKGVPYGDNRVIAITDSGYRLETGIRINVVEDSELPSIDHKITSGFNSKSKLQNIDGRTSYVIRGNTHKIDFDVTDNSGLKRLEIFDVETGKSETAVDINNLNKGSIPYYIPIAMNAGRLKLVATDVAGNKREMEFNIIRDMKDYRVISATLDKTPKLKNGKAYLQDSVLAKFKVDGIGDYEVFANDTKLNPDEPAFQIAQSGKFEIKVVNMWGETLIDNFYKSVAEPNVDGSFVIDREPPKATISSTKVPATIDNQLWYAEAPTLAWTVTDNEGIESINVEVNGQQISNTRVNEPTFVGTLDMNPYVKADESNHIRVTVSDYSGRVSVAERTFYVDNTVPTIKARLLSEANVYNEGIYSKVAPRIRVWAETGRSGLSHITVNGERYNNNDEVQLDKSNNYRISATNKVGTTSGNTPLADLIGHSGKNFIFDEELPEVEVEIENSQIINGQMWVTNTESNVIARVKDNEALDRVEIHVDGKPIRAVYYRDGVEKNVEVTNKMSDAQEDRVYQVYVKAVDKAGNVKEYNLNVEADTTPPNVADVKIENSFVANEPEGVYLNDTAVITMTPTAGKTGVKRTLLNDQETDIRKVWINEGVTPIVEVFNGVGVSSGKINLMHRLGYGDENTTKQFIIDKNAPQSTIDVTGVTKLGEWEWSPTRDKEIVATIKDDRALRDYEVLVNDKQVAREEFSGTGKVETSKEIRFNLKDYEPDNLGRYRIRVISSDKAGTANEEVREIFVDETRPRVTGFEFIQEGYKEGKTLTTDMEKYGFFFKGSTQARVNVVDEGISSGLAKARLTFTGSDGNVRHEEVDVSGGYATFNVPDNFKGWVSAEAMDNIGHKSDNVNADGVITETANWHVSTSKVDIVLPHTPYRTADGTPLYPNDFRIEARYSLPVAGVSSVEWSTGNKDHTINAWDKNLGIGGVTSQLANVNQNGVETSLVVTDKVGHSSSAKTRYAIDKDAPIVNVTYNETNGNNLYGSPRVATITITERNFNPAGVTITGTSSHSGWVSVGDTHTTTMTFPEGNHNFSVTATDLAGHVSQTYNSGEFEVDTTAPVFEVSLTGSPRNGNFYAEQRTATIRVTDRNFDASRMNIGGGQVSWAVTGDGAVGTVVFGEGEHQLTVSGTDALGHAGNPYSSEQFIVDLTKPEVTIGGISDGASYTKNVQPFVAFSDKYINTGSVRVVLRGRKVGTIELKGSIQGGRFYVDGLPEGAEYDDIYEITAHVEDMAGNTTSTSMDFILNRSGSAYKFDMDNIIGGFFKRLPHDIKLVETSVTKLDLKKTKFTYSLNGKVVELDIDVDIKETQNEFGHWVYEYTFPKEAFNKNGVWGISVSTVDVNGLASSSSGSVSINFVIDDATPAVSFVGVKEGAIYYETERTAEILISDNIGVTDAVVEINGVEQEFTEDEIKNGSKKVRLKQSNKPYRIMVRVKDRTGNAEEAELREVFVASNAVTAVMNSSSLAWVRHLILGVFALIVGSLLTWWYFVTKRRRNKEAEMKALANQTFDESDSN